MARKWYYRAARSALLLALLLGSLYSLYPRRAEERPALAGAPVQAEQLIIDAGHGGEDGGAVSLSGVPESGINLAIALKLDQLLGLYGTAPILLRNDDRSLHDPEAQTLREKKVSDLHNRVETIERYPGATLISIHQNTFQSQRYHGAQVFYSPTPDSQPLAGLAQSLLRQTLDPSNERVPTQIPESVYLMNHITCRAILVECGFLSNPEEDRLLQSEDYQLKISAALAATWLRRDEAAVGPEQ